MGCGQARKRMRPADEAMLWGTHLVHQRLQIDAQVGIRGGYVDLHFSAHDSFSFRAPQGDDERPQPGTYLWNAIHRQEEEEEEESAPPYGSIQRVAHTHAACILACIFAFQTVFGVYFC